MFDGEHHEIDNRIPGTIAEESSVFYVQGSNVTISRVRIKNNKNINYALWAPVGHIGATICITPMEKGDLNVPAEPIYNIKVDQIHVENSVHGRFVISVRGSVYGCDISNIVVQANGMQNSSYKVGVSVEHTGEGFQPRDITVKNTQFYEFDNLSYGFYLSGAINCLVENGYMDNTPHIGCYMFTGDQSSGGLPITLTGVSITVKNLRFFKCQGDTFLIAGNAQPNPVQAKTQFIIENCYVGGYESDIGATGLRAISTAGSLRVTNTIIENIAVGADFTDCSEVSMKQLTFNNILQNGTNLRSGKAIILERSKDFEIEQCDFDQSGEEALWISESNGNSIKNCTFKNVYTEGSDGSEKPAIALRNYSSDNLIQACKFGFAAQTSAPFRWITIEFEGALGTGICQYNKIISNTFFKAQGENSPIYNGIAASTYELFTVVSNNRFESGETPVTMLSSNSAASISVDGNCRTIHGVTAAPTVGTWLVGERAIRKPAVGEPKGWLCTEAGSPGTWVSEGDL